tara:strand:+ start:61 stop:402 length:342 start_codon:yes stop_codon:yes gene_type:complete
MIVTKKRTVGLVLTTGNQDIYTVPANHESNIKSIFISNLTNSTVTFSLDWYDSENTTYHTIAEATTLKANALIQITEGFWLHKADVIRGLASANTSVQISINVEEEYVPKQFN